MNTPGSISSPIILNSVARKNYWDRREVHLEWKKLGQAWQQSRPIGLNPLPIYIAEAEPAESKFLKGY